MVNFDFLIIEVFNRNFIYLYIKALTKIKILSTQFRGSGQVTTRRALNNFRRFSFQILAASVKSRF